MYIIVFVLSLAPFEDMDTVRGLMVGLQARLLSTLYRCVLLACFQKRHAELSGSCLLGVISGRSGRSSESSRTRLHSTMTRLGLVEPPADSALVGEMEAANGHDRLP